MERTRRYFISFMFFKKDETHAYGSTVVTTNKLGWNIQDDIKTIIIKEQKEFIDKLILLNFKELKPGEFEDVK